MRIDWVCIFLVSCVLTCCCHMYSEEYNQGQKTGEGPFRAKMFNFIWEKASRRLNPDQKQTFLSRLVDLDKEFIKSKHRTMLAKDGSSLFTKSIDDKVTGLLTEYHLEKVLDSIRVMKDTDRDRAGLTAKKQTRSNAFQPKDKKLKILWKQVQQLGLDKEESLRRNFIKVDHEVQTYRGK
ncbi:unnamed protein product [Soboliphyme baturini]|uniref:Alpha-2-MRAP_N domain-containing protein n=1 Tax=Soboliphyme baturini TaxID=241478 RepID=A0A183J979_9BILA|nr:unnamed protein product [Soboliphyme baturini]